MPRNVGDGGYIQRQRVISKLAFWAGIGCLLLYVMPFTNTLKYNLLLLGYLLYIAPVCFVIASLVMACRLLEIGRFRYIREGIPMAVKVLQFEKVPKTVVQGVPTFYCYAVRVEIRDPKTGNNLYQVLQSPEFPVARKDFYTIALQPGQWVTALYLPGKFPKSLQLYGFLELNPNRDLVQQTDKANIKKSSWLQLLIALGAIAAIIAIFWDLYAYEHYQPVDAYDPRIVIPAVSVGVIAFLTTMLLAFRSKKAPVPIKKDARKTIREKIIIPLGVALLSSLTILSLLFGVNALLDSSKPEYKPVQLTKFTQTTYNLIYRTYQIEYDYPNPNQTHDFQTTYEHINKFQYKFGIIELHRGFLGWPWVRQIIPAIPAQDNRTGSNL